MLNRPNVVQLLAFGCTKVNYNDNTYKLIHKKCHKKSTPMT